jgi:DNA mismatch endonuclease, patch repair protein
MALSPYPNPTSAAVSVRMRANKKRDTKPELVVRSLLHGRGLRFRKHLQVRLTELTVRPDIVFPRQKLAVFIDGCFWHNCPTHGNVPRANTDYWRPKLQRNVERDQAVNVALVAAGWSVIRAWEHEPAPEIADRISVALAAAPDAGSDSSVWH